MSSGFLGPTWKLPPPESRCKRSNSVRDNASETLPEFSTEKRSKCSRVKELLLVTSLVFSLTANAFLSQFLTLARRECSQDREASAGAEGSPLLQKDLEEARSRRQSKIGPWTQSEFQRMLQRAEAVFQRHQRLRENISGTAEELSSPFPDYFNRTMRQHHPFLGAAEFGMAAFTREYLMVPNYPCFEEERVGRWGEGGKWLCMISLHKRPEELVVYSVGSNGDSSFERGVFELLGARSHTFDPFIDYFAQEKLKKLQFLDFHRYGLAGKRDELAMDKGLVGEVKDLATIMRELGHKYIDLLKVDCEGCEVGFVDHLFNTTTREEPIFGQLLLEIHNLDDLDKESRLLCNLRKLGFRMFHQEVNFFEPGKVFEVAFIHESFVVPENSVF